MCWCVHRWRGEPGYTVTLPTVLPATGSHRHTPPRPSQYTGQMSSEQFFFCFFNSFFITFLRSVDWSGVKCQIFPSVLYSLFIGQLTLSEYGQYLNVIIYHFYISWRDRLRARMSSIKCPVRGDSYLSCQSQRTLQDRLPPGPRTPHGALSATRCDGLDLSTVLQMCQDITTWDPTRHWLSEAVRGIFLKILQSHQHFYSFRGI